MNNLTIVREALVELFNSTIQYPEDTFPEEMFARSRAEEKWVGMSGYVEDLLEEVEAVVEAAVQFVAAENNPEYIKANKLDWPPIPGTSGDIAIEHRRIAFDNLVKAVNVIKFTEGKVDG